MRSNKTTVKTAVIPQVHGGALLLGGKRGNKGGGRKPDEFKALCRELVSGAKTMENVREILADTNHPHFMSALKWAAEHGYGKAKETVEHQGTMRHGVVILPTVRAA